MATAATVDEAIQTAFDAEQFRREGHALVDTLAAYLQQRTTRQGPVLPWLAPEAQREAWRLEAQPKATLGELLSRVLERSQHLHHPGYVGHQVCPPLPQAALTAMCAAVLNNSVAVYEMSPATTAIEVAVLRWMARVLGMGDAATGVLTSGGSLGNLTGLLTARQVMSGFDVWQAGAHAGPPLGVLVAEQAHYSIGRAARVLGFGDGGVIPVEVDERYRLRPEALLPALERGRAAGRKVIALAVSAGSTATGAYDPIEAAADFCQRHGLWLHVDAAHGGAAGLSPKYRHLLAGLARADSVVWDAHKMLLMPSLMTAVLYRSPEHACAAFAEQASYLFGSTAAEEWFNVSHRTLECTKNSAGLMLYAALVTGHEAMLCDYVTRAYDLGKTFAAMLNDAPDFELATEPDANIVCFRLRPAGMDEAALDGLQARLRQRVIESGKYYLVQVRLRGRLYLRTTLVNPITTEDDLRGLLATLRALAS